MKVSVILTLYNEEKYLKNCLTSLAEQTCKDFEIIAIDDGSTDRTKKILDNFKKKLENLRIFRQKHQGLAAARNFGASQAKGKILVFLDGDMFFSRNFLKMLIAPIEKKEAKGTFSTEEYVANWNNVWARCWNYNWNLPDKRRIDVKRKDQAKEFRAILKNEYLKVGGLDSWGYTDSWSLSQKLGYLPQATKGKYFHYNPEKLSEVFFQALWVGNRKYKLGMIGKVVALLRANPIFSLIIGLKKAILKKEPYFIFFKVIFDLGIIIGILRAKKYA